MLTWSPATLNLANPLIGQKKWGRKELFQFLTIIIIKQWRKLNLLRAKFRVNQFIESSWQNNLLVDNSRKGKFPEK